MTYQNMYGTPDAGTFVPFGTAYSRQQEQDTFAQEMNRRQLEEEALMAERRRLENEVLRTGQEGKLYGAQAGNITAKGTLDQAPYAVDNTQGELENKRLSQQKEMAKTVFGPIKQAVEAGDEDTARKLYESVQQYSTKNPRLRAYLESVGINPSAVQQLGPGFSKDNFEEDLGKMKSLFGSSERQDKIMAPVLGRQAVADTNTTKALEIADIKSGDIAGTNKSKERISADKSKSSYEQARMVELLRANAKVDAASIAAAMKKSGAGNKPDQNYEKYAVEVTKKRVADGEISPEQALTYLGDVVASIRAASVDAQAENLGAMTKGKIETRPPVQYPKGTPAASTVTPPAARNGQGPDTSVKDKPLSAAEAVKLPKGTVFLGMDGKRYTR